MGRLGLVPCLINRKLVGNVVERESKELRRDHAKLRIWVGTSLANIRGVFVKFSKLDRRTERVMYHCEEELSQICILFSHVRLRSAL